MHPRLSAGSTRLRPYSAAVRRTRTVLLAAVLALLVTAPSATAADTGSTVITKRQALNIALRVPAVKRELAKYGKINGGIELPADYWLVQFRSGDEIRVQVDVDAFSGRVLRVYTGDKAAFPLARGPASGFAQRKLNALWAWIPLTLIFVFAFFDRRRPWRLLHFDLIAIVALGVSVAFWMDGDLDVSVPLVYPTLAYVLVRTLIAGLRPQPRAGRLTWLSPRALTGLTLTLLATRIVITLLDKFVSDIGYASAAGANRILDGLELYSRGGLHFDTYGPLAYLLYIPFEVIWPFRESETYPSAGVAAAVAWDLLTVAGLIVLGRRLRLGWTLALAWVACPFTAMALSCGTNDALVAALIVWALVAIASPPVSGVLAGAAAAAKIAPGFVVPVLARGIGSLTPRRLAISLGAAALIVVVSLAPLLPPGGLGEFYDATIGFQLHRESPFSIWSQYDALEPLQTVLKAASLLLALALALVPCGRRTMAQMAALATAVLVAAELPLQHWFYLYVPWFLPLYCVALFSETAAGERPAASQP
jgi:Glycosyltransferase family 87